MRWTPRAWFANRAPLITWPTLLMLVAALASAHAQDPDRARSLAATCANCHGTTGQALGAMKPLAGQPADKIITLFSDYRAGRQKATVMHQIARGYDDAQVRLIAGWFAAQAPRP